MVRARCAWCGGQGRAGLAGWGSPPPGLHDSWVGRAGRLAGALHTHTHARSGIPEGMGAGLLRGCAWGGGAIVWSGEKGKRKRHFGVRGHPCCCWRARCRAWRPLAPADPAAVCADVRGPLPPTMATHLPHLGHAIAPPILSVAPRATPGTIPTPRAGEVGLLAVTLTCHHGGALPTSLPLHAGLAWTIEQPSPCSGGVNGASRAVLAGSRCTFWQPSPLQSNRALASRCTAV